MLTVIFFSCKKDNNNINDYSGNQTLQNNKNVIELIQTFENKLTNTYKSGETMELDSAVWNMEALQNYSYSNIEASLTEVSFEKTQYTLTVDENNNTLLSDVQQVYTEMVTTLSTQISNENAEMVFVDVNTDSVVGTTAYLSATAGIGTRLILGIYQGFTSVDNWIWGTLGEGPNNPPAGKCDGTQYGVSDGSNEIQRRLNYPVLQSGERIYFYTGIEHEETMGYFWYDTNGFPMLFVGYNENDCITYDMMEYYLINSHNIINGGLNPDPNNLSFVAVEIIDQCFVGDLEFFHLYEVTYGIPSYVAPAN